MKKRIIIALILILCVFLLSSNNTKDAFGATVNHKSLVNEYYFDGVHTKKSNIYLTTDTEAEIAKYFHGDVAKDRTTYYKENFLLMGDIDGGFDEINSGYRTVDKDMKHFTYQNGLVVDDYTVSNTKIHDFYVTLKRMKESTYFDSTWVNGVHNVTTDDDKYLYDFLAYTAPCLTDLIFDSFYITRIGMKLTITEETNPYYGDYMSMKIYICPTDEGKTGSDLILSEARIYKGNFAFDETVPTDGVSKLKEAVDRIGSNCVVKTKVYFNDLAISRVNILYKTNFYCEQTTLFTDNYLYRYSDDLYINDAYYNLDGSLYHTNLEGETLEEKLNSTINLEDSNVVDFKFFNMGIFDSTYVDNHGHIVIKHSTTYSKEYLGFTKIGEGKYWCDRIEVINDFINICSPGFTNEGTYMTFRYVTVEINPTDEYVMRLRLYASPTQIGKLIPEHKDSTDVEHYLLLAEAYICDLDSVNINALENNYN